MLTLAIMLMAESASAQFDPQTLSWSSKCYVPATEAIKACQQSGKRPDVTRYILQDCRQNPANPATELYPGLTGNTLKKLRLWCGG
jgi:hypothetical protein